MAGDNDSSSSKGDARRTRFLRPHLILQLRPDAYNEHINEEEEEGEDLFNDNFMEDYRGMGEQDQYED
ncbi:DNA helicase [Salvia divinorum]|uniref:DNA helicase n=1 Tax=Salvia divinorum TaxID=28513 RepID=A0ABD1H296_SALDI